MKPTEILSSEHCVIEHILKALTMAADKIREDQQVRPGFFIDASDFIKEFADGCHHKKEEGVLFKAMAESGMSLQNGPIAVMLHEHEQGRLYTREMREAARRLELGDDSARKAIVENALGYTTLLRQHIYKEDNILFPMANRAISLDHQNKLISDFERLEQEETGEGIHEKYLAMAEALEKETLQ